MVNKVCLYCLKDFNVYLTRKDTAKFCSKNCKNKSQVDKKRDKSVCLKISISSFGKIPWNKGLNKDIDNRLIPVGEAASLFHKNKTLTIEHRQKICESHKKRWEDKELVTPINKQIRKSIEYKIWRELVFKRDKYTCNKCKTVGGNLHPHHILNFSKHKNLRFDVNNGVTLCIKCHSLFHKFYKQNNNSLRQINKFIHETKI